MNIMRKPPKNRNTKLRLAVKCILERVAFWVGLMFLCACSKSNFSEETLDFRYEYYPLALGQQRIFRVDSIVFDPAGGGVRVDSTSSFLREVLRDTFRNASGELSFRVESYTRKSETDPWKLLGVGSETQGKTDLRVSDGRFALVQLAFPPTKGKSWSSTPYVSPDDKILVAGDPIELFKGWRNARISAFDEKWNQYPQTLEVQVGNYENVIELRRGVERYAPGLGLVYREFSALNTQCLTCRAQPWRQKASTGFIVRLNRL
jgi:hypothetical protein